MQVKEIIDPKTLYLIRTLSRTKRKDYENYVINAVWHKLGNNDLEVVSQQYVEDVNKKTGRSHYFIDLYFPSLNIGIECDEAYHKRQSKNDKVREVTIFDILYEIKANAYEIQLNNPKLHNFFKALPVHLAEQADESLKSVYNLDFLGISKPFLERELEKRLIEKLKLFILELGSGFTFIGNQYRLPIGNNEYFVDLLFFNRKLKCLVAIELKTGKFEPEYAGKMDFYLNLLNDNVKLKDEKPSIGIILCAEKDNIVVEYALRNVKNPVGIAKYHLTSKLPYKLKGILPGEKELKQQLKEEI